MPNIGKRNKNNRAKVTKKTYQYRTAHSVWVNDLRNEPIVFSRTQIRLGIFIIINKVILRLDTTREKCIVLTYICRKN